MTDLIVQGMIAHFIADWIFQNEWMALNKSNVRHPAGYVHAGIHILFLLFVFTPAVALVIGILHFLIDTRKPVTWWQQFYHQTTEGLYAPHVQIWLDQVLHIVVIALFAGLVTA